MKMIQFWDFDDYDGQDRTDATLPTRSLMFQDLFFGFANVCHKLG